MTISRETGIWSVCGRGLCACVCIVREKACMWAYVGRFWDRITLQMSYQWDHFQIYSLVKIDTEILIEMLFVKRERNIIFVGADSPSLLNTCIM